MTLFTDYSVLLSNITTPTPKGPSGKQVRAKSNEAISQLTSIYLTSDGDHRQEIINAVQPYLNQLFEFSYWMAVQSVRASNQRFALDGLIALAIENLRTDPRDTMVFASLLLHSAERNHLGEGEILKMLDSCFTPEFHSLITKFIQRPKEGRCIQTMGYEEGENEFGFTYFQP